MSDKTVTVIEWFEYAEAHETIDVIGVLLDRGLNLKICSLSGAVCRSVYCACQFGLPNGHPGECQ